MLISACWRLAAGDRFIVSNKTHIIVHACIVIYQHQTIKHHICDSSIHHWNIYSRISSFLAVMMNDDATILITI